MSNTTRDADKQFPNRIDLPADQKADLVALLNQQLANLTDLFSQTKHAHWNVKGPNFYGLHRLFDDLAEIVEGHVDTVAERLTALGGVARGTVRMAADGSELDEFPLELTASLEVVDHMAKQYARAGNVMRDAVAEAGDADDDATADLLTGVVEDLDKGLYFLDAHLQK